MRILLFLFLALYHFQVWGQDKLLDVSRLNSYADEQIPLLTEDGKTLFFTRAHHQDNVGGKADKGDIWFAQLTDSGAWTIPKLLAAPINTVAYNGVFNYATGNLHLYSIYRGNKNFSPGISIANPINWPAKWQQPRPVAMAYFNNKSANNGNAIAADGQTMMLSLESYKTFGAEDLYVSFWQEDENKWSEPKNLGPIINTPLQELTPFLSLDNKTLFFASNGHGGLGSRDIFVSQRLDDSWTNWSTPKNLGAKVNSDGAEMGYRYYPALELAVYTSTRHSDGYGDIHLISVKVEELNSLLEAEIEIPVPVVFNKEDVAIEINKPVVGDNELLIKGKITDAGSGKLVFANISVKSEDGYEQEHFNDTSFSFILNATNNYVLQIEAEGYISKQIELVLSSNTASEITQNIRLQPIKVGTVVNLENVLFVKGTTKLLASSNSELDLVAKMMLNNPTLIIELAGHTDSRGNATLNINLSQQRVDAVMVYLVDKGVAKSRLSGKGYGGAKPIADNATEATRKLNRRVEFKIVKR